MGEKSSIFVCQHSTRCILRVKFWWSVKTRMSAPRSIPQHSLRVVTMESNSFREICPKTITSLLYKLMDNHQTFLTPITSPKQKKVLQPMTSPIKHKPVTSPKKHIIRRHHFSDLSCILLSQSYFWDKYLMIPSSINITKHQSFR